MKPLHIFYVISFFFAAIIVNLFKIQIIDHAYYRDQSERNRIRPVMIEAPRGAVSDRFGRELISNRLTFDCYIIPQKGKRYLEKSLSIIAEVLRKPKHNLHTIYKERKKGDHIPVLIAENIPKEECIIIEEMSDQLPGVFIKTRPVRFYPLGSAAAHALGYVGLMTAGEYAELKSYGYGIQDAIGKDGIEKFYDSYLRGVNGAVKYEADSRGRLLRVLSIQEPVDGKSMQLTMDLDLQLYINDLLKQQAGAVAVMELKRGGILAFVNSPAFDPNLFVRPQRSGKALDDILSSEKKPLISRAHAAAYPPGSTFKIVTAYAGLVSGKASGTTEFFCPGHYMLGSYRFNCWRRSGHGTIALVDAIARSCNVFFWNIAMRIDPNDLAKTAQRFGFGRKTGIDLPNEKDGLIPTKEWKRKVLKETWYRGETLNAAIGQGFVLTTPLQVLRAASVVATEGYLLNPHFLKKIDEVDVEPRKRKHVISDKAYLQLIGEGMRRVVQSPEGTGQNARALNLKVAGKTGTAQASGGDDHAWFVGYAAGSEPPEVAIVVFLEHGGKGGLTSATIAGKTFTWMSENGYFR